MSSIRETRAAAIAASEAALKAHNFAMESRRESLECIIACYEASVIAADAINADPAADRNQKTLTKSHLVSLHAQGVMLAKELDGPERGYAHRLREITQRRKGLLGY